ncbi:MAG: hypothetical protein ACO3C1_07065 [Ilumatobacteraceae bacterium]
MSETHHRPDRTAAADPADGPAPVRCAADAVAVISLALHHPPVDETICFTLDESGTGGVVIAVEGTARPDDVLGVVAHLAAAAEGTATSRLVVASVRPHGSLRRDDAARWGALVDAAALFGVEVIEWFVVDSERRALTPRALTGDPAPWPVWPQPTDHPVGAAIALGADLDLMLLAQSGDVSPPCSTVDAFDGLPIGGIVVGPAANGSASASAVSGRARR